MVDVCHLGGGAGEFEAVAGEIGEVLDFAFLVVMGEDGGVVLGLEVRDFVEEVGHGNGPCFLCGGGRTHMPLYRDELASPPVFYTLISDALQYGSTFSLWPLCIHVKKISAPTHCGYLCFDLLRGCAKRAGKPRPFRSLSVKCK